MERSSVPVPRAVRPREHALPLASGIALCLSLSIGTPSGARAQSIDLPPSASEGTTERAESGRIVSGDDGPSRRGEGRGRGIARSVVIAERGARRARDVVAAYGAAPDCAALDGWRAPVAGQGRRERDRLRDVAEASMAKGDGTASGVRGPSHRPDRADNVGASLRPVNLPWRATLIEGGDSVRLTLSFTRGCGEPRPATLSLAGRGEDDERDLVHRFEHEEIAVDREETTLTLSLGVAMAPILEHTRELRLRIEQGTTVREVPLLLDIKPIEAPDVYLLAGQSNMEGYSEGGAKRAGAGELDEPHPRIRQLNVTSNSRAVFADASDFTDEGVNVRQPLFPRAEDPLHDPRNPHIGGKRGTFVGPGLSFAKAMLPHTTRDVYLVPAAWGATGFCANHMGELAWNAEARTADALGGSLLLERALLRLDATLRESGGILRGILWHQGGADSNDIRCAERYAENLVGMVERLRREARPDARGGSARGERAAIPFVAATMSKGVDERGDYSSQGRPRRIVDGVHRSIADLLPYADFVNGDDLVPPAYPCGQNSCVHYGAEANREQGWRFAEAIRRIADR